MKFSSVAPLLAILGPAAAGVLAEKRQSYPTATFYSDLNWSGDASDVLYDQECIPLINVGGQEAVTRTAAKSIYLPSELGTCTLYSNLNCADGEWDGPKKEINSDDLARQKGIWAEGDQTFIINTFKCTYDTESV